ncbi:flavin-binding monooxygenase [Aspergillus bombycis]|uniref:Flavin-binding monooxygenase n=1 Tax=Aspergillus bombycis TaxID=109264 RepID=A0A1F8ADE3_9EURO|nr:flavin-binding monooxygenase [Aspergillus bombycis]OGM49368.1 flavin-binding monooxygenase [Aspergillus bombycis]
MAPKDTHSRSDYFPVVIIGAGLSGIAAGCQLKTKLGLSQFRIYDRNEGVGGTWWVHRYPGVACDVPASLYSYSFAQNPSWSTLKPSGEEIATYIRATSEKFGLCPHIQLNTEVSSLIWDEQNEEWEVSIHQTPPAKEEPAGFPAPRYKRSVRAKIVISATGKFAVPRTDSAHVQGIEHFRGDVLHTARWDANVNLEDKDVIVIGAGCSAAQLVPALLSQYNVRSVTQLVRTAPWVSPNLLSSRQLRAWEAYMPWLNRNIPGLAQIVRMVMFLIAELTFFRIFKAGQQYGRKRYEEKLRVYMERSIPRGCHKILTPPYELGCKRLVHDAGWFQSLWDPRLHITDLRLDRVEKRAVILRGRGEDYQVAHSHESKVTADVIIMATGYDTSTLLHNIDVIGSGGAALYDYWTTGGLQAYQGLAVPGFKNLFLLLGPNSSSGHTSVMIGVENSIHYILKLIKPILELDVSSWDIKAKSNRVWTENVQRASQESVWVTGGCHSWYVDDKGWNSAVYP